MSNLLERRKFLTSSASFLTQSNDEESVQLTVLGEMFNMRKLKRVRFILF